MSRAFGLTGLTDSDRALELTDNNRDVELTHNSVEKNHVSFAIVATDDDEESVPEKTPKDLSWTNVNFRVKNKAILKDCWGEAKTGELCAIMGPSGAGKSSLLNVLAGRSSSVLSAGIEVAGKELAIREGLSTIRDVQSLKVKFGITLFMNLLYGLIFYQIGTSTYSSDDNLNSHFGALMMLQMFALMGSAQSVLLAFPYERPMVMREYVTGTYGIPAYFLCKIAIEIPIVFIQMLVGTLLSYFLMGLQGNFIYLVLISWGLGLSSCSIAMGLGCLVPDVKNVSELVPLAYTPQMMFAGFYIRISQIPVFLRWARYLCGVKYAIGLAMLVEFNPSSHKCNVSDDARSNCENLLSSNDVHTEDVWLDIFMIFVLFAGFRVLGAIVLYYKAKRFY
eukprot:gene12169-13307_t